MATRGSCFQRPCWSNPLISAVSSSDSCPVICLTVEDANDLPDPPEGCEFALLAVPNTAFALYEWDGAAWENVVGIVTADFEEVTIATTGSFTVTINGVSGLTSADSPYTIPTPTGYVDATFVDGGCQWEMERLEPVVELGFELIFDDIATAAGILGIVDINDVAEWNANTFMNFTSVVIAGQKATFFGWNDTEIPAGAPCFTTGALILQYVHDLDDHILSVADYAFQNCNTLGEIWLNGCTAVGVGSFEGNFVLVNTEFDSLITVGDYGFNQTQADLGTYTNITSIGLGGFGGCVIGVGSFPALTFCDSEAFSGSDATSMSCPILVDIPVQMCRDCLFLTSISFPLAETSGNNCFTNCPLLLSATLPSLISLGHGAFAFTAYGPDGMQNLNLPVCTTFVLSGAVAGQVRNCGSFVELYAPLLTAMGDATDNTVFENITGNTIDITVAAVLETIDGGNPDGDLVYVAANNTTTITYI